MNFIRDFFMTISEAFLSLEWCVRNICNQNLFLHKVFHQTNQQ